MSQRIRFAKAGQWAPEGPTSNARLKVTAGQVLDVPGECPQWLAERAVEKGKAMWVIPHEPVGPQKSSGDEPGPKPKAERKSPKRKRSYIRRKSDSEKDTET